MFGFLSVVAIGAGGLAGCGLGEADDTVDLEKTLCRTDVTISGTMVPAAKPVGYPDDLGETNCWPVGDWTFTATKAAANEDGTTQCASTDLLAEYKVRVVRDFANDDLDTYTFLSDPSAYARMKVSSGGGGLCEGVFEFYSADGKILHNLHPALQPASTPGGNHTLTGHGEYQVFEADQRVNEQ